jgi:hypothetical protein
MQEREQVVTVRLQVLGKALVGRVRLGMRASARYASTSAGPAIHRLCDTLMATGR